MISFKQFIVERRRGSAPCVWDEHSGIYVGLNIDTSQLKNAKDANPGRDKTDQIVVLARDQEDKPKEFGIFQSKSYEKQNVVYEYNIIAAASSSFIGCPRKIRNPEFFRKWSLGGE